MTGSAQRTMRDVITTCLWPEFSWQAPYEMESRDGADLSRGWLLEVEWLGLHLHIAGGIFRPGRGA